MYIIHLLLNLVMLYALIPIWGLEGAAWATCLSSLAYNLFKYLFIYLRFKLQPFDKRTLYIAIAITLTYGIIQFLPLLESVILNIAVHTIIACLSYGILIWYSHAADDLKQLLPFFKNK